MTTIQKPSCIQFNHWIFDSITHNVRTHVVQDEDSKQITKFDLVFSMPAWGQLMSFPCDSAGNVSFDELPSEASSNYLDAVLNQHCYTIECVPHITVHRTCSCGSGEEPESVFDARGIYLCACCSLCKRDQLARYRKEVLYDPEYFCEEPIEPDSY